MKIGVFDSGIGGTTVLAAIKKQLAGHTNIEYRYIADRENCPYGEKSDDELYKIVRRVVDALDEWGAEIVVIACNTATTKCIAKLRKDYPGIVFVGTEPAVKLAADSGASKILLLATPGTVAAPRTKWLIESYVRPEQKIILLPCPGLADTIEENINSDREKIVEKLTELLAGRDSDFDAVVLGCTHYPLIRDEIQKFYPGAKLLDGGAGVAREVERKVERLKHETA